MTQWGAMAEKNSLSSCPAATAPRPATAPSTSGPRSAVTRWRSSKAPSRRRSLSAQSPPVSGVPRTPKHCSAWQMMRFIAPKPQGATASSWPRQRKIWRWFTSRMERASRSSPASVSARSGGGRHGAREETAEGPPIFGALAGQAGMEHRCGSGRPICRVDPDCPRSTGRQHAGPRNLSLAKLARGLLPARLLCPCTRPPVQGELSRCHVRQVAPGGSELHHLLTGARQLRPPRFGFRVLLDPAESLAREFEVHLAQPAALRAAHRKTPAFEFHQVRVFLERLAPHQHQRLFQGHLAAAAFIICSNICLIAAVEPGARFSRQASSLWHSASRLANTCGFLNAARQASATPRMRSHTSQISPVFSKKRSSSISPRLTILATMSQ